jgi:hypothetical protein
LTSAAQADSIDGAGDRNDSTPLSGSDRGAMVDDPTGMDGNTSYNAFLVSGFDSYRKGLINGAGTVHGVKVTAALAKSDAGVCEAKVGLLINGNEYLGDSEYPSVPDYDLFETQWELNPDTGLPFTPAEIDDNDNFQFLISRET